MSVWLSVWSEVQIVCMWSSWCHCIPTSHHLLSHLNPDWFYLSGVISLARLSWKRTLNGCSTSSSRCTVQYCTFFVCRTRKLRWKVQMTLDVLSAIHTARQTIQDVPVCVVLGGVNWVFRQSGKVWTVSRLSPMCCMPYLFYLFISKTTNDKHKCWKKQKEKSSGVSF